MRNNKNMPIGFTFATLALASLVLAFAGAVMKDNVLMFASAGAMAAALASFLVALVLQSSCRRTSTKCYREYREAEIAQRPVSRGDTRRASLSHV